MIKTSGSTARKTRIVERETLLRLLRGALAAGEARFARQAALAWLAAFPGDLEVRLLQGQVFLMTGQVEQAFEIFDQIMVKDPLYRAASQWMAQVCRTEAPERCSQALTEFYALGGDVPPESILPWGATLRAACRAADAGHWEEVGRQVQKTLRVAPYEVLPCVMHLRWVQATQAGAVVLQTAQLYRSRWPECLPVNLIYAVAQIETGKESDGVWLLHQCAAEDTTGQVARRLWGEMHHYRSLWADDLVIPFDYLIPANVSAHMGWNQLPAASMVSPLAVAPEMMPKHEVVTEVQTMPEAAPHEQPPLASPAKLLDENVRAVEKEMERLAHDLKQPGLARQDGRYPVYVIFTHHQALLKQYGAQTAAVIDVELRKLAAVLAKRPGWSAMVFTPDEETCTELLGIPPVTGNDPWKLKLALADLDKALYKRGQMIGALLIVGGDGIVPFHRLPNPTDDFDRDVPSDSPYGTLDANYFIPDWPVGRLPGEAGEDAGLLLAQVRRVTQYHESGTPKVAARPTWLRWLERLWKRPEPAKPNESLGYTAAVWRRSSLTVFRAIGAPHTVMISPPTTAGAVDAEQINAAGLGYYNLHGTEDGAEWYGQRDPAERGSGPDYPVALSPRNLKANGCAPQVVFSEACYGGHVTGKNESQSVALKFLGIGTQAVVASTCIAYGSVMTPLIAADLLGSQFWKHLKAGHTVGDALLQARVDLGREMERRQGYLDGEDQKALISFVLYGDPLLTYSGARSQAKGLRRAKEPVGVKTVREQHLAGVPAASSEVVQRVKKLASAYLPGVAAKKGMTAAEDTLDVTLAQQQGEGSERAKSKGGSGGRLVVTVSKQMRVANQSHRHYVRVTLDEKGKAVKLAVSR